MSTLEKRIQTLKDNGCTHEGYIVIPKNKEIVPVDTRRLKGWSDERFLEYLEEVLK